jgi:chemotaxis protein methyltransferase CheR
LAITNMNVAATDLEDIEIKLLLEGVSLRYGYDFKEYALGPLRRSLALGMAGEGVTTISAYQDRLLHDAACMKRFLSAVGVTVTSMFREAETLRSLREEVVPLLRTYPSVRIWVVGCATGEEVYSLGIVLSEEGIYDHCRIYATDLNEEALATARAGSYALDRIQAYEPEYLRAGGRGSLSDHYNASGNRAHFNGELQRNITWAQHNLATDASFNEFHLIVCTNVLIYFRPSLQQRAHRLFFESLIASGYLALGKRESLIFCPESSRYQQVGDGISLYRRIR